MASWRRRWYTVLVAVLGLFGVIVGLFFALPPEVDLSGRVVTTSAATTGLAWFVVAASALLTIGAGVTPVGP